MKHILGTDDWIVSSFHIDRIVRGTDGAVLST